MDNKDNQHQFDKENQNLPSQTELYNSILTYTFSHFNYSNNISNKNWKNKLLRTIKKNQLLEFVVISIP